jgi:hypothetical protein
MLGPDGLDIFLGAYAPSREGDQRSYCDFIRDTADWEYADEHHLRALAMLLAVRVVVVPRYADRAVQVHGAAPPERTIYLGNDDVHYVWLADPLPLSPGSLGAPAVVDLLKDSESGVEELPGRGRVPRSKKPPARKACQKSVAKKAVEKPPNGGRFRRGNKVGEATRFRRKVWKYRGACRECDTNDNTRNGGKDWYCTACRVYTKKGRR